MTNESRWNEEKYKNGASFIRHDVCFSQSQVHSQNLWDGFRFIYFFFVSNGSSTDESYRKWCKENTSNNFMWVKFKCDRQLYRSGSRFSSSSYLCICVPHTVCSPWRLFPPTILFATKMGLVTTYCKCRIFSTAKLQTRGRTRFIGYDNEEWKGKVGLSLQANKWKSIEMVSGLLLK